MSDTNEKNGNGSNRALMALVAGAILTAALSAWASSGSKALEKAQALEVSQAAVKAEVDALRRDIAEIKQTTQAIWKSLNERKERER